MGGLASTVFWPTSLKGLEWYGWRDTMAFFALLLSFPWEVLTVVTLAFLATLPLGWWSYQSHVRKDAEALAANGAAVETAGEAAAAQELMQKGGAGKIVLLL